MRTAGLALSSAVLLLAAAARASTETPTASDLVSRITMPSAPAKRAALCAELSRAPLRGPNAFAALSAVMDRDASRDVRLAAAKALATWTGPDASARLERFFKTEPDEHARRGLLSAMAAERSRLKDQATTSLMIDLLSSDPAAKIRRDAAVALGSRGDPRALDPLRKEAISDENESVRGAAAKATATLLTKIKPTEASVKNVDPCPSPWGWCECGEPLIKAAPKCLKRRECINLRRDHYLREGMTCTWDEENLGPPR